MAVGGSATARVQMSIRDAAGKVVFSLTGRGGSLPTTGEVFLDAGAYTVSYAASDAAGAAAFSTSYTAFIDVISDPIGIYMPRRQHDDGPDEPAAVRRAARLPAGGPAGHFLRDAVVRRAAGQLPVLLLRFRRPTPATAAIR